MKEEYCIDILWTLCGFFSIFGCIIEAVNPVFSIFFIVDTVMLSGFPYEFNKSLLFKIISPIFHCMVRIYLCFFIYPILLLDECGYKSIIYITLALLFNYLAANTLLLALMAPIVGLFIVIYKTKNYDIVRNLPSQFYQNLNKYFDYKVLVNLFAIIATINFLAFIIGPIIFFIVGVVYYNYNIRSYKKYF